MDQLNLMISKKMEEITTFSQKMQKHKTMMKELLKDQEVKQVAIQRLKQDVEKRNQEIQNKKSEIKTITRELATKSEDLQKVELSHQETTKEKIQLENQVVKWKKTLEETKELHSKTVKEKNQEIDKLEETVQKQDVTQKDLSKTIQKITKQKDQKEKRIQKIETIMKFLEGTIKLKEDDLKKIQSALARSHGEVLKKQNEIADLNKKFKEIKTVNSKITLQEDQLKRQVESSQQLVKKLAEKMEENTKQYMTVSQKLQSSEKTNQELKNEITQFEQKIAQVTKASDFMAKQNMQLEQKNAALQSKVSSLSSKIANNKQKETNWNQLSKAIKELRGELAEKEQQLSSLSNENSKLGGAKEELNKRLSELSGKLQTKDQKLSALAQENFDLAGHKEKLNQRVSDLAKELAFKDKELEKYISTGQLMQKRIDQIGRGIASVKQGVKYRVASSVAERLRKEGLKIKVDPNTGNLILQMDDTFLFKRNSAYLTQMAKNNLKKLIPIYVDEVFNHPELKNRIDTVNIIGHASPRHRQKYVDPRGDNQRAYHYNLDLSTDRAMSIVKHIFSSGFGNFPNKKEFRTKVQAIGKSYSAPVARTPASNELDVCGKYDCRLSRRVEISFTLKENQQIWNSLSKLYKE